MYRGFACPYDAIDRQFIDAVEVTYAAQFTRRFVRGATKTLKERASGLARFLVDGINNGLTFDTVWDPAFAQVRLAVLQSNSSALAARAAALALRLCEKGCTGEWEAEFAEPIRLQFGRWILPTARWIKVSSTATTVFIDTKGGARNRMVRFQKELRTWKGYGAEELPVAADGRYIVATASAVSTFPLEAVSPVKQSKVHLAKVRLGLAITLLARYAPVYVPWLRRVLRRIIPVESEVGRLQSGSDQDHPGTIYLSTSCPIAAIAEMLVHEASHQYYFILRHYGAFDDGSGELHFSPIKGCKRPIDKILLAYHAFANVLLLYRSCLKKKIRDGGYCRESEPVLVRQLRELEKALATTKALTPLGQTLWRPLAERLRKPRAPSPYICTDLFRH